MREQVPGGRATRPVFLAPLAWPTAPLPVPYDLPAAAKLSPTVSTRSNLLFAQSPTPEAFLMMAYVATFPSILSYLFFNRGVDLIGANRPMQMIFSAEILNLSTDPTEVLDAMAGFDPGFFPDGLPPHGDPPPEQQQQQPPPEQQAPPR